MNWRELDDKIDDYVIGRRWSEEKCWVELRRIGIEELKEIFESKY
jgi:hypothetical protein